MTSSAPVVLEYCSDEPPCPWPGLERWAGWVELSNLFAIFYYEVGDSNIFLHRRCPLHEHLRTALGVPFISALKRGGKLFCHAAAPEELHLLIGQRRRKCLSRMPRPGSCPALFWFDTPLIWLSFFTCLYISEYSSRQTCVSYV